MWAKRLMIVFMAFFLFGISGCSELETLVNPNDAEIKELKQENKELNNQLDTVFDQIIATSETARESNIYIKTTLTYTKYFGNWERQKGGQGSGFIFNKDDMYYYALTNFHVVSQQDADEVDYLVRFSSGNEVEGTLIAKGDEVIDLAVIRFPISNEDVPLTSIDPTLKIDLNDFILVVGNPSGLQNVVSTTQIKGIGQYLKGINYEVLHYNFSMETSGNSGGAVVDLEGRLVGIHTWGSAEDINKMFAIPLPTIYEFLDLHELI